jgi:hypothetical protein
MGPLLPLHQAYAGASQVLNKRHAFCFYPLYIYIRTGHSDMEWLIAGILVLIKGFGEGG